MQLCNNEVLAREGIDTSYMPDNSSDSIICNNEVLAREGIDTTSPFGATISNLSL